MTEKNLALYSDNRMSNGALLNKDKALQMIVKSSFMNNIACR